MKKIFILLAAGLFSMGVSAQTTTYKMRVLKTDGTEVFYQTADVQQVDFIEEEEQQQQEEPTIKVFLSGDNPNKDGQCRVQTDRYTGPDGQCFLNYPSQLSNDPNVKHGVII